MHASIQPYQTALMAMTVVVILFMVQTFVAFYFRVKFRPVPGVPIEGGPDSVMFRVDRARGNMIEVLGPFVLGVVIAVASQASHTMVNVAAIVFTAGRILHTISYYANVVIPRRIGFIVGNIATVVVIISIIRTW